MNNNPFELDVNRSYAVIGTGAVGGFYGARLQRAGLDVHFLLHGDYETVRGQGLRIDSTDGDFLLPYVNAYSDVSEMPRCDVVIVALKATHNHLLPRFLPQVIKPEGVAVVIQNGLGGEEDVAAVTGADRVIGGLAFLCAQKIAPGHIQHLDYGQLTLGEFRPEYKPAGMSTERLQAIGADFKRAEIPVTLADDLLMARWRKLLWNIPFNGLSVVLNATTEEMMNDEDVRTLVTTLMEEVRAGAAAHGRNIPREAIEQMLEATARMRPYKTSMRVDMESQKALELAAIFGKPLAIARTGGVAMPYTEMLYRQLTFLDRHNRPGQAMENVQVNRQLSDLVAVPDKYDRTVTGLVMDSRRVDPGMVFFACQGHHNHGKTWVDDAIRAGAAAVVVEEDKETVTEKEGIPYITLPHLAARTSELAAKFYEEPSHDMRVVGITGTNGKTTVSHLIAQSLPAPCGLMGSLGYGIYGLLKNGPLTTPDALQTQAVLDSVRRQGAENAVMEVSSHALDQGRVKAVRFHTAVFTNLTQDHLDYHGDMEAYAAAKQRLFIRPGLRWAVLNQDDPLSDTIMRNLSRNVEVLTFSPDNRTANLHCRRIQAHGNGYRMQIFTPWGPMALATQQPGYFNISNMLAALGALLTLDISLPEAAARLMKASPVPGRMELCQVEGKPAVYVDYAHTPDALANALQALRERGEGKLWCVFGCGGERDVEKRPLMGEAAAQHADRIVVTDDNPRHEASKDIIAGIVKGVGKKTAHEKIPDRAEAIRFAVEKAAPEDIILVAGKGHETHQQVGDEFLPFNDREQVMAALGGA